MYDTINLILPNENDSYNFLESVPPYLANISEHCYSNGYVSINGNLGSLSIRVNENSVKLAKGSISKYYLEDNFKTMYRGDAKRAIEKISDELHLPFLNAKVTRIDIAQNLLMKYPEKVYLPHLGNNQFYSRLEANHGLYYNNSSRTKVFYEKIREQKKLGNEIPLHLKERSLLRYELRFTKRIPQQFRRKVIAEDLYNEDFYCKILARWEDEYLKINKVNNILHNMEATGSTKVFKDYLALIGLAEIGFNKTLGVIKEWQEIGEINRKQASDLRKQLKALNSKPKLTEKSELIEELDTKIKEAVYHFR